MHHRAAGVASQSGWGWGGLLLREGALQTCKPSQREATNLKLENSTLIAMPSSQSVSSEMFSSARYISGLYSTILGLYDMRPTVLAKEN